MTTYYKRRPANEVFATTDAGEPIAVPGTSEGHLEVEVHGPRLPFGALHTERLSPVFQVDPVYGVNAGLVTATTGSGGGATASDSAFVVSTGASVGGFGAIQSRKRLRYRPGQGVVGRFTMRFPSPVASSVIVAGLGHAEDGVYFGYNGTSFGILHSSRGSREVRTLTVSVASSHAESVTVTLNGTPFTVAVTNSGSTARTAYEISRGTFTGWAAEPVGATVVFVRNAAGTASAGAYTLSGTSATGTFAQTKAGAAASESWVAQADWNGDKLDGTGPSGITADWAKFNVAQIGVQYLGGGPVTFDVETIGDDANNPNWTTVHTLKFPNARTTSSFGNPSFPFTLTAYSAGSTTNVTAECCSFAGFTEGEPKLHGNRFSYINNVTSSTSVFKPLFTVQNTRYYGGRTNQGVINLLSLSGSVKGNNAHVTFYLLRNATLSAGNPSFAQYATNSMSYVDTAATECTYATNDQIVWTGQLVDGGNFAFSFSDEITVQPGESLTLAVKSIVGTATCVGSLNTREDQ